MLNYQSSPKSRVSRIFTSLHRYTKTLLCTADMGTLNLKLSRKVELEVCILACKFFKSWHPYIFSVREKGRGCFSQRVAYS